MKHNHYCKVCETSFIVEIPLKVEDAFIECPNCRKYHYRHFEAGIAVHCDLHLRVHTPAILKATQVT
jgi:hypothetical protein